MEFKKVSTQTEKQICFEIRKTVFVQEQNVPIEEEFDEFDDISQHFLVYNNEPVATARMRITKLGVKLERIAVLKKFRMNGIGNFLVKNLLTNLKDYEYSRIYLNSQKEAIGFYRKFGFTEIGEDFMDCNIVHKCMEILK